MQKSKQEYSLFSRQEGPAHQKQKYLNLEQLFFVRSFLRHIMHMDMSIWYVSEMRVKPTFHYVMAGFHYHCDAGERETHWCPTEDVWDGNKDLQSRGAYKENMELSPYFRLCSGFVFCFFLWSINAVFQCCPDFYSYSCTHLHYKGDALCNCSLLLLILLLQLGG